MNIELEDKKHLTDWLKEYYRLNSDVVKLPHIPYNMYEIQKELTRRDMLEEKTNQIEHAEEKNITIENSIFTGKYVRVLSTGKYGVCDWHYSFSGIEYLHINLNNFGSTVTFPDDVEVKY